MDTFAGFPNIIYHMKCGAVGYTKITKLGLAKLYHARDNSSKYTYGYLILRISALRTNIWTVLRGLWSSYDIP